MGVDTSPGVGPSAGINRYWLSGEGLAKWANSPTPWTTLHALLLKYMSKAKADGLASGYYRLHIAASDRIYHVGQLLPIHGNCKCTIAAVTEDYDPADDLNAIDLNQLYKDSGGTSGAHLKRTRYQVDEHGELGPVLVPKAKYKPRSQKSKVRVGGTALLSDQPARADVAKHQIGVLEANLAKMRAEGVSDDSSKVAYHLKLIAKLRKQLDDGA
jgi:hypothetical protein